jgi:hypothetical protein
VGAWIGAAAALLIIGIGSWFAGRDIKRMAARAEFEENYEGSLPFPAGTVALFPPPEEAAARVRHLSRARQIALTRRAGRHVLSDESRIEVSGAGFTSGGNSEEPGPAGT